ncbi:MAG: hypothetical protein KAU20_06400 [Nanoarchaeota archaeon]|nr:hypothetical protein [Nanoarchaeota archaeon]
MKKRVVFGVFLLSIMLLGGCQYLMPIETEEEDISYINISELIIEGETEGVEELVEDIEELAEEIEIKPVKETPVLNVKEGELVSFPNLEAVDPDGDKITYKFASPLDEKGEWQTKEGDAGIYKILITASDGKSESSQEVEIVVEELNKPPVLEKIKDMTIKEGETLKLEPKALDPEGKPITITYSGWMNSDTKETDYNMEGTYIVRITVSDGVKEVFQDVKVTVEDVNRAPVFKVII